MLLKRVYLSGILETGVFDVERVYHVGTWWFSHEYPYTYHTDMYVEYMYSIIHIRVEWEPIDLGCMCIWR